MARYLSFPERAGAPRPETLAVLTEREREVLGLVAAGLSNDEIARYLVVSPTTAKTHVNRAMVKLGARPGPTRRDRLPQRPRPGGSTALTGPGHQRAIAYLDWYAACREYRCFTSADGHEREV